MDVIRVLVVDDSILFRHYICDILNKEPDLTVVGTAPDAQEAAERIVKLKPDVITLDIEMPGMNGLLFLKRLMRANPLPVIMVSSYTEENGALTIEALASGATDFALKPNGANQDQEIFAQEIIQKIRTAARANLRPAKIVRPPKHNGFLPHQNKESDVKLVAIGASTGGTRAIYSLLAALPEEIPAVIIVQHMPVEFTGPYAKRLDELLGFTVKEAEELDDLRPGRILIAPGNRHLKIESVGPLGYRIRLINEAPVHHYKPSIDLFFQSVANTLRSKAIGIILTGMGRDGARGLLAMRECGAFTLAQDKATSHVFGMPKAAIELGAPCEVASIERIPERVLDYLRQKAL